jgi:hypothetical protein
MCSLEPQLEQAVALAEAAVRTPTPVQAALVFGSVARCSADDSSDIDLLLVTGERVRVSDLATRFKDCCDVGSIAITAKSWSALAALRDSGSLFFRHLQMEGKVLEDESGRLEALLAPPAVTVDIASHRSSIARSLALYEDVTRLGHFHLFALAHLYVLGKRAGQLCLQEAGRDVYDPDLVFQEIMSLHPDIRADLNRVRQLRFLHGIVRGQQPRRVSDKKFFDPKLVETTRRTVGFLLHQ